MISKNDCILLLTDIQESGIDIGNNIYKILTSENIPIDVLEFINSKRQLELTQFYEKLRKSYNNKKSKLYKNIVKEATDPSEITTILSSYGLQASLYSKTIEGKDVQMFLRHARLKEVHMALSKYYMDFDLSLCINLLKLIRADLIACETINGRRKQ